MENNHPTPPALKTFCVYADHVVRCYQEVEAGSPQEAYETAMSQPECWENCYEFEDRDDYHLSRDVQDILTGEYVPVGEVARCKTCGCEIVETVNDSLFHDGECGGCEYRRYQSQPELLECLDEAESYLWTPPWERTRERGNALAKRMEAAIAKANRTEP